MRNKEKETSLKDARASNNLEKFIKDHEQDQAGDKDKLDKTISRLAQGKSKPKKETSQQR